MCFHFSLCWQFLKAEVDNRLLMVDYVNQCAADHGATPGGSSTLSAESVGLVNRDYALLSGDVSSVFLQLIAGLLAIPGLCRPIVTTRPLCRVRLPCARALLVHVLALPTRQP